jgi:hypothetical protein
MLPETKDKTLEELNKEARGGGTCDSPMERMLSQHERHVQPSTT